MQIDMRRKNRTFYGLAALHSLNECQEEKVLFALGCNAVAVVLPVAV